MMKVWIVIESTQDGGDFPIAVCAYKPTQEEAEELANSLKQGVEQAERAHVWVKEMDVRESR